MSDDIIILRPLTREQAHARACKELGRGSVVGMNRQYPNSPFYVGVKERGEWVKVGLGKTWNDAFDDIRPVKFQRPNGTFEYRDAKKKIDEGKSPT
jgi:hypothetical protein